MKERGPSIYYRTYAGENKASRPSWYSKEVCLRSFMYSYQLLKESAPSAQVHILHDGSLSENKDWTKSIEKYAGVYGDIVESKQVGNCEASLNAIHLATERPDNEVIIFAEDDYLWLGTALPELMRAVTSLPCDYATPYDHPAIYLGLDYPHWHAAIYTTQERHWASFESTCMTFATTTKILKQDLPVLDKYHHTGQPYPDDREFFREVQGLGPYQKRESDSRRLLLGSLPALATHVHMPFLSYFIDWEKIAKKYSSK